jgi:hypothetical protein
MKDINLQEEIWGQTFPKKRMKGKYLKSKIPKPSSFITGLGKYLNRTKGVGSITTDDRYWILDASGKNGITFSKKRRNGDKEKRRWRYATLKT